MIPADTTSRGGHLLPSSFDAREADRFGESLAGYFAERIRADAFQWKLRDAGNGAACVDELTGWLMVRF